MKEIIFFPIPHNKKILAKIISVKTRFNKKFLKIRIFLLVVLSLTRKKIYFLNFSYLFHKKIEFVLLQISLSKNFDIFSFLCKKLTVIFFSRDYAPIESPRQVNTVYAVFKNLKSDLIEKKSKKR